MSKCIFLIVGPAGSGKTSILSRVLEKDRSFRRMISLTTREPRPGEIDGEDYLFIGRSEFDSMRDSGALVEWSEYDGEMYGTPISDIMEDVDSVKIVTENGAKNISSWMRRFCDDDVFVITILILARKEDIRRRLSDRGCSEDKIVRSIAEMKDLESRKDEFSSFVMNDDGKIDISRTILAQWMRYGKEQGEILSESSVTKPTIRRGNEGMPITLHEGSIPLKSDPSNFRQILCESSTRSITHYVTIDAKDGTMIGCSCEAFSMNPTKNCKHMDAVLKQRLFQIE